jgi:ACR3 family arsenite efflux pump ArsB
MTKIKEFIKNNWREIARYIVALNSIFWMFAYAPFGFMFKEVIATQVIRVETIFLSTALLLYLLKKNK